MSNNSRAIIQLLKDIAGSLEQITAGIKTSKIPKKFESKILKELGAIKERFAFTASYFPTVKPGGKNDDSATGNQGT